MKPLKQGKPSTKKGSSPQRSQRGKSPRGRSPTSHRGERKVGKKPVKEPAIRPITEQAQQKTYNVRLEKTESVFRATVQRHDGSLLQHTCEACGREVAARVVAMACAMAEALFALNEQEVPYIVDGFQAASRIISLALNML